MRGHHDRIVHIEEKELKMFSKLVGNEAEDSWKSTPMVGIYAKWFVIGIGKDVDCSKVPS